MVRIKPGLCSVTFRKKSIEEIIAIAVKAGIHDIEWGSDVHVKNEFDAIKTKELCDKENIKITSYGSYFNSKKYDKSKWLEICKTAEILSAKSVRIWLGEKGSKNTSESEYKELINNTAKMCKVAADFSLLVCAECHDNTYNDNTDAILRFINDLGMDNFRTYFQSRYYRPEYDLDRIERTFSYIENIHVSFRDLKREQILRKKDGKYIDNLLERFKDKDFNGTVMIEFVCRNSENEFLKDAGKLINILR